MCGIAGRVRLDGGSVGADIVELAACMRHRGPDSTGFAVYGPRRTEGFVVRLFHSDRAGLEQDLATVEQACKDQNVGFTADPTWDDSEQAHVLSRVEVGELTDINRFTRAVEKTGHIEVQSVGRSLEIIKDVGDARAVDARHHVSRMNGTHALSNMRLATESLVSPIASHPFWARPFPDVCIVHNGQLTNYFSWRRRLERDGYQFVSQNDSELIAVWNSIQVSNGMTVDEALTASQSELDGVFTYLLGTLDGIGMAKDRWAIKPLAAVEVEGEMAIATEEQALRSLYVDEVPITNYDGPLQTAFWSLSGANRQLEGAA